MTSDDKNSNDQRFQILLMKAVDEELEPDEQVELERLIAQHPEYARELSEFKALSCATRQLKFKEPPEETWPMYWTSIYNRLERSTAWIVLSIGMMILLGYGLHGFFTEFLSDESVPLLLRIGVSLVGAGVIALFVSVSREKLFVWKTDPYKEIQR